MSSIYDWSLFAASNANADDVINWAEGQPPSSVNNSARSMMQRLRELLFDLGGTITATGTANNIAVRLKSPVTSYIDGIIVRFRALIMNNSATTLNINNIGMKPVYKASFSGIVPLSGNEIQAGGIYEMVYSTSLNGNAGGWLLLNPTANQTTPTGAVMAFAMKAAPADWLPCDGAAVSRTAYANLFKTIGTFWGAGDGSTTFNVPDFRGMFLRGWDNSRGIDVNRPWASRQESNNKAHTHEAACSTNGGHTHDYTYTQPAPWQASGSPTFQRIGSQSNKPTSYTGDHLHTITIATSGGSESRPVNLAVFHAIKT